MINLLPKETKKQIRAARMNVMLRNYCFLLIMGAVSVTGIFGAGLFVTFNDKANAEVNYQAAEERAATFAKTRQEAETFAKDLTLAKSILSSEVSLTQTVINIANVIPSGVVLNTLTLSNTTATQAAPIDISARAKSNAAIIDLRDKLEASDIFEKVTIANITIIDPATIGQVDPIARAYPYSISLKAQFEKKKTATTPATPQTPQAGEETE